MAELEQQVLRFLEAHPHRSFKIKELSRQLRVPGAAYRSFRRTVLDLAAEGRIAQLPRRRVQALSGASVLEGRIAGVGGAATHVILADDQTIPLAPGESAQVAVGDRVELKRERIEGEWTARVRRILTAAPRSVFGSLLHVGDRWVLLPDQKIPGLSGGFFIDEHVSLVGKDEDALAVGWLPSFEPATERPVVECVEVLGASDHPRPAMARRIAQDGWPRHFGVEAEAEAERASKGAVIDGSTGDHPVPDPLPRRSLVDDLVFTIDPHDAKDHDDAISIRSSEDGGYLLGVHIADVASFVAEGGALDREARVRATSVYPPGDVLPMLPETLSGGACSLHHGVTRRAITVMIRYDAGGYRLGFSLGASSIESAASLSYKQAEALLSPRGAPPPASRSNADPDELRESLARMLVLAGHLRRRRRDKGSVFIERPERVFRIGDDGRVVAVERRPLLRSHWIVEEFMLEANRAVAECLHAAGLPLLWRVHDDPVESKVEQLVETLQHLGIRWTPNDPIGGHDYQALLKESADSALAPLVSSLALRSFMKAAYRRGWGGHFGLAFSQYTHFTSPIRRYPDLHNQRWLHAMLRRADRSWMEDALAAAEDLARRELSRPADWEEALRLADHCSEQERRATAIERGCADICAADWLRAYEGDELDGMVVGMVPSGLFVELEEAGLDGFVGVEELPGDWYTFDPRRTRFVGEKTGRQFRLGQRVRVLLEHVDVATGRVWLSALRTVKSS